MKKLIIISDTHGNYRAVESLLPRIAENDYIVHLGDGAVDMREVRTQYPEKVYACSGNCDFFSPIPEEGILEVECVRIFYCHGHKYRVKSELTRLAQAAKEKGCDIALYGHTHQADITEIDGVTLINPGSFKRSVENGGSYCYLVINREKFTPVIVGESVY